MPPVRPGSGYGTAQSQAAAREAGRQVRRYAGYVVSIGDATCDVLMDGATRLTPGVRYGMGLSLSIGQRVEIRDVDGVPEVANVQSTVPAPLTYVRNSATATVVRLPDWMRIGFMIVDIGIVARDYLG